MHRVYDVRVVPQWAGEGQHDRMGTAWIVDRAVSSWWARSIRSDLFVCPMSRRLPFGDELLATEVGRCLRIARAWSMHRLACDLAGLELGCPALIVADRVDELGEVRLAQELRELYGHQPHTALLVRPELPPADWRVHPLDVLDIEAAQE